MGRVTVRTRTTSREDDARGGLSRALPRGARWLLCALTPVLLSGVVVAGNVVEYVYDAAGNITQIRRLSTIGLAIASLDPGSGPEGAAVTVFGSGFNSNPSSNLVKFNGVSATVTAAQSESLMVTVPAGATSGRVTVTVAGVMATSPADFVVTIPEAPSVTGFSPSAGVVGATVSVSGFNFDPPGSVTVKLNSTAVAATVGSQTSLSFAVPASTASGRITVTNAIGLGSSNEDFIVVPSGYNGADIITTRRLVPGQAGVSFPIGTASKHGLILFDGNQDTHYTLQFGQMLHSPSTAAVNYKVYKPDNTVLMTGNVGYGYRPTIHLPKLPSTGTYSIMVSPGVATLSSIASIAADPVLAVDGPAAAIVLGSPSQSARVAFEALANQNISAGVTGLTLSGSTTGGTAFKVYKPDASPLSASNALYCTQASSSNPQGNCDGEFTTTVAGVHTMIAEPPMGYSASFGARLSSEVTGELSLDVAKDFALVRVGQDARFTFTASVGDSFALDLAGVAPTPHPQNFGMSIHRPNGTLLTSATASPPLYGAQVQLGAISTAGTYAVTIDPAYGAHGTARLTLKQGPLLATSDPPSAFATSVTGETQRFRFQAAAGQNLSLGLTGLAYLGTSSGYATLTAYKPDGTWLNYAYCYPTSIEGRCKMMLANVPVAGTYSIGIQPPAGVRLVGNISLSAEQTGTLTENAPVTLSVTRPGQNVRYTFAGTAGQSTAIELAQLSPSPAGPYVYLWVLKPDGTSLTSASATGNGLLVNLASLPVTGNYAALIDANFGIGFSGRLMLDPGVAAAIDGATQPLATAVAGETIRLAFPGTSGTRLEIGLDGLAYGSPSSAATSLSVYRPDGAYVAGASCYTATAGGGCKVNMPATLPSTGTYSITVAPPAGNLIAGATLALSTPASGTLVVGDPSLAVSIARPGQSARYTFNGGAGQLLRLNWTGATVSIPGTSVVAISILKPDGGTLTTSYFGNGATGGVDIPSLPATGTYTVVFSPSNAATMTAPATLVTR